MRKGTVQRVESHFWRSQRVLVTGGTGFVGSHLTRRLLESGAVLTVASRSGRSRLFQELVGEGRVRRVHGDLRVAELADRCTRNQDIVFHCASKIAGLAYNCEHAAQMLAYNTILDLQVLDAAARNGVKHFVYPSGALVYDKDVPIPAGETASVTGDPVEACKGASWAKRVTERALSFFEEEFGMHTVIARFSNLYGPGDDFEPETAHLIGNAIRLVAHDTAPEIWGDGLQLRSYLYVTSAIDAILRLVETGWFRGPINIGGQVEYTVRDIVNMIIEISGKPLKPIFRPERPTGLDRKLLDITRFRELTDLNESVPLREGLERTYDWYCGCRPLDQRP